MADKQTPSNYKEADARGYFSEYDDTSNNELRHYWYVLVNRKWGIIGLVIATGLLATVLAFSMQPIYRSTATLLIGGSEHMLDTGPDMEYKHWGAREQFFATQYQLLKSSETARAALERLNLDENSPYYPFQKNEESRFDWRDWIPASWLETAEVEHTPVAESDPKGGLIKWLLANLIVSPVAETSMVNISFDSPNKSLAAKVANAVAEAYIETNLKQRLDSSTEASDWLKQQLEKSQQSVLESVEALQRYREDAGLLDMGGIQSVYAEQIRIIASEITGAHRARLEAENLYTQVTNLKGTGQVDSLPVVFNNPWLRRLRQEEEQLERQIELDAARFQGDYPGSSEARQNLNTLKIQIKSAVKQVVDGLKTDYELAVSREKQIKEKLKELEDKVQKLNAKEFHAQALEQVVSTNRQSYDAFLSKLMKTTTRGSDTISLIARIVDLATPAKTPYKPQKKLMIALAVTLALLMGVGLAILLDRLDNTLKSREDVEERLGLPVLGELIQVKKKSKENGDSLTTEFRDNPKTGFAEAIRTIRTEVILSSLDESEHQVLIITSTVSGEGKSTLSLNLALAFGDLGNVLLVDADLRQPSLDKRIQLPPEAKGLAELVAGTAKVAECIHPIPGGIHVLPAGNDLPPDDPLPILISRRFSELLRKLSTAYDTVVIDSAPVELVSDARVLGPQGSGFLYVIKSDETPYQAVRHGLKALSQTDTPILGAVLNNIDPVKAKSYAKYKYGYDRYAHYGYGESS